MHIKAAGKYFHGVQFILLYKVESVDEILWYYEHYTTTWEFSAIWLA